mmetsp:Transcript_14830/g.40658  ORF Transcript_14830/g.40658 Transcript_14830/m.40658 type:complete len:326 (+) Transcript_14830:439-1416(+)
MGPSAAVGLDDALDSSGGHPRDHDLHERRARAQIPEPDDRAQCLRLRRSRSQERREDPLLEGVVAALHADDVARRLASHYRQPRHAATDRRGLGVRVGHACVAHDLRHLRCLWKYGELHRHAQHVGRRLFGRVVRPRGRLVAFHSDHMEPNASPRQEVPQHAAHAGDRFGTCPHPHQLHPHGGLGRPLGGPLVRCLRVHDHLREPPADPKLGHRHPRCRRRGLRGLGVLQHVVVPQQGGADRGALAHMRPEERLPPFHETTMRVSWARDAERARLHVPRRRQAVSSASVRVDAWRPPAEFCRVSTWRRSKEQLFFPEGRITLQEN